MSSPHNVPGLKLIDSSQAAKVRGLAATYRAGTTSCYGTCPATCALNPAPEESTLEVDRAYFGALLRAVPAGGHAFTFTHFHPRHWANTWRTLAAVSPHAITTVNYSADTLQAAHAAHTQAGVPTTLAVSLEQAARWSRAAGRHPDGHHRDGWRVGRYGRLRVVRCPHEYGAVSGCRDCGRARQGGPPLCADPWRSFAVGFTAHGSFQAKVGDATRPGGCYASTGPAQLAWRRTVPGAFPSLPYAAPARPGELAGADKTMGAPDRERRAARAPGAARGSVHGAALLEWTAQLPPRTITRHHIAGDIGREVRT